MVRLDFIRLMKLNNEKDEDATTLTEYKQMKHDVEQFFRKFSDKKLTIHPNQPDDASLVKEFIDKILPLTDYILMRDMLSSLTDKVVKLLGSIEVEQIRQSYNRASDPSNYGKSISLLKLGSLLNRNDNREKMQLMLIFFYNLKPEKKRPFYPNTAGVPEAEYDELASSDGGE